MKICIPSCEVCFCPCIICHCLCLHCGVSVCVQVFDFAIEFEYLSLSLFFLWLCLCVSLSLSLCVFVFVCLCLCVSLSLSLYVFVFVFVCLCGWLALAAVPCVRVTLTCYAIKRTQRTAHRILLQSIHRSELLPQLLPTPISLGSLSNQHVIVLLALPSTCSGWILGCGSFTSSSCKDFHQHSCPLVFFLFEDADLFWFKSNTLYYPVRACIKWIFKTLNILIDFCPREVIWVLWPWL